MGQNIGSFSPNGMKTQLCLISEEYAEFNEASIEATNDLTNREPTELPEGAS
jgi:hypothetical protein